MVLPEIVSDPVAMIAAVSSMGDAKPPNTLKSSTRVPLTTTLLVIVCVALMVPLVMLLFETTFPVT